MVKEILSWLVVAMYIAGVIGKMVSDRKRSKKRAMTAVDRPAHPVTPPTAPPRPSTPILRRLAMAMVESDDDDAIDQKPIHVAVPAAQTEYTFTPDDDGVSATDTPASAREKDGTGAPLQAIAARRLSPRRRALRRTIILGEMLAPKFDTVNRF